MHTYKWCLDANGVIIKIIKIICNTEIKVIIEGRIIIDITKI